MPVEIPLKSFNPQQSDWSSLEPVDFQQQQPTFQKSEKINARSNQIYPTASNSSNTHFDSPSNNLIIANQYTHNIVRWVLGNGK
jgi:hypothetical protein